MGRIKRGALKGRSGAGSKVGSVLKGRPKAGSKVKPASLVAGNSAATLPAELLLRICSYLEFRYSSEWNFFWLRSFILSCLRVNRHWCSVFASRMWTNVVLRTPSDVRKVSRVLENPGRSFAYNTFIRNFSYIHSTLHKTRPISLSLDLQQIINNGWTTLRSLGIQTVSIKSWDLSIPSNTLLTSLTLSYCVLNVNILIDFVKATSCLRKFSLVLCDFVIDAGLNGRIFQERLLPHLGGLTHIILQKRRHKMGIWDTLDELGEKCPLLENVAIIGSRIDNTTLEGLATHCEKLVQLDLSGVLTCAVFKDAGLPNLLEKRPGIKTLDMKDTWWSYEVYELVKKFPNVLIRSSPL